MSAPPHETPQHEAPRVVITGIGLIHPLADSSLALHAALCEGRSEISPIELFDPGSLPCRTAAEIRELDPKAYLGNKNFRPLDRTSRLSSIAASLALAASGLAREDEEELSVGLVLGTTFGSIHTISAFDRRGLIAGPSYVKPLDFANSVINAPAGQTAIWHKLAGMNTTITGGPTAGLQALAYAADMVRSGQVDAVLAGGAEELCFESYFGFARAGLLSGSENNGHSDNGWQERALPFHPRRNGFVLAEGAALLAMETAAAARARGISPLAEVVGHATAYDTSRGRDAASASRALARAVRLALADADLSAADLDAWVSGASGSRRGDAAEARGAAEALGERLRTLPTTAPKGWLGESLGASGGFQAAMLVESMRSGRLPGSPALPAAAGEASQDGSPLPLGALAPGARDLALSRGLLTAVGLDGNNTAVILERWHES